MATLNFLYRSTKEKAPLILRLLFRHNNKDYVFGTRTKIIVSKIYWKKQHNLKRPKDIEISNKQTEIKNEINSIENYLIDEFNKVNPEVINKKWLAEKIEHYYNPPQQQDLPNEFLKYFDVFLKQKKSEITESTIKKYNTVKELFTRYENGIIQPILIKDIDLKFKTDFEAYCIKNKYAPNTIARALRSVKTICMHAKYNGIETSYQLENIKPKYTKVESVYLTTDEIEKIKNIDKSKLIESYENARDWLIISCFTGQRVSDFMRFTNQQIRVENGKHLIEFTQKKTNKLMTVPLHSEVLEILEKRGGKFPKQISDQKYNDYIKKVCKIAKLNEKVKGSKKTETEAGSKIYRKEIGIFEKWELVTSHIGRRSFATNFYGEIPTTLLINVTGHSTEKMFLNYIGKSNKDLAMELIKYF